MSDQQLARLQESVTEQAARLSEQSAKTNSLFGLIENLSREVEKIAARVNQPTDLRGIFGVQLSVVTVILAIGTIVMSQVSSRIDRVEAQALRRSEAVAAEQLRDHQAQLRRTEWMGKVDAKVDDLSYWDRYRRQSIADELVAFDSRIRERVTTRGFSRDDADRMREEHAGRADRVEERLLRMSERLSELRGEISAGLEKKQDRPVEDKTRSQ